MAGQTRQITYSSASPTNITATIYCKTITVREDASVAGYPTTKFIIKKPVGATAGATVNTGGAYEFIKGGGDGMFAPNEIVGSIQPIATSTFSVDEDGL